MADEVVPELAKRAAGAKGLELDRLTLADGAALPRRSAPRSSPEAFTVLAVPGL